jgi:predicted alpha/beta superfamily hydrolase
MDIIKHPVSFNFSRIGLEFAGRIVLPGEGLRKYNYPVLFFWDGRA